MTKITETNADQLNLFSTSNEEVKHDFEMVSNTVKTEDGADAEIKYLNHPEWCYQFFDDEPVVFAFSKNPNDGAKTPLQIVVQPIEGGGIFFRSKGMVFKIFARELSEASKIELEQQKPTQ
jgi:hypothetical protein